MSFAGIEQLRPRVATSPRPGAQRVGASRWLCSYCLSIREGDSCRGCGAPRSEGSELVPEIAQPQSDWR